MVDGTGNVPEGTTATTSEPLGHTGTAIALPHSKRSDIRIFGKDNSASRERQATSKGTHTAATTRNHPCRQVTEQTISYASSRVGSAASELSQTSPAASISVIRAPKQCDTGQHKPDSICSSHVPSIATQSGHFDLKVQEAISDNSLSQGGSAPSVPKHVFQQDSGDTNKFRSSPVEEISDSLSDADAEGDTDLGSDYACDRNAVEGVVPQPDAEEKSRVPSPGVGAPLSWPNAVDTFAGCEMFSHPPAALHFPTNSVEDGLLHETVDILKRSARTEGSQREPDHAPVSAHSDGAGRNGATIPVGCRREDARVNALTSIGSRCDDPSDLVEHVDVGAPEAPRACSGSRTSFLSQLQERAMQSSEAEVPSTESPREHHGTIRLIPTDIGDFNITSPPIQLRSSASSTRRINDYHFVDDLSIDMTSVEPGIRSSSAIENTTDLVPGNFRPRDFRCANDDRYNLSDTDRLILPCDHAALDWDISFAEDVSVDTNAGDQSYQFAWSLNPSASDSATQEFGLTSLAQHDNEPAREPSTLSSIQGDTLPVLSNRTGATNANWTQSANFANPITASQAASNTLSDSNPDYSGEKGSSVRAPDLTSRFDYPAAVSEVAGDVFRHSNGLNTAEYVVPFEFGVYSGQAYDEDVLTRSQHEVETANWNQCDARASSPYASLDELARNGSTSAHALNQAAFPSIGDSGVGIVANIDADLISLRRESCLKTKNLAPATVDPHQSQMADHPSFDTFRNDRNLNGRSCLEFSTNSTTSSDTDDNVNRMGTKNDNGVTFIQDWPIANSSRDILPALPPPVFVSPLPVKSVNETDNAGSVGADIINSIPLHGMFASTNEIRENAVEATFPPPEHSWQSGYSNRTEAGLYQVQSRVTEPENCSPLSTRPLPTQPDSPPTFSSSTPAYAIPPLSEQPSTSENRLATNQPSESSTSGGFAMKQPTGPSRKRSHQSSSDDSDSNNARTRKVAHTYPLSQGSHTSNRLETLTEGFIPTALSLLPKPAASHEADSPSQSHALTRAEVAATPTVTSAPQLAEGGSAAGTADEADEKAAKPAKAPRKKIHACWMCHKSFDRPSTLRKHLLVHTGEKAYVCNICNRRFGVASNLNRHTRRCALKPVNASRAAGSPTGSSSTGSSSTGSSSAPFSNVGEAGADQFTTGVPLASGSKSLPFKGGSDKREEGTSSRGRERKAKTAAGSKRRAGSLAASDVDQSSSSTCENSKPSASASNSVSSKSRPKRRRRAPSPSRWIPDTLRNFNLNPPLKPAILPLPPVSPYYNNPDDYEERDSFAFDENHYNVPGVSVNMNSGGVGLHASIGNLGEGLYHPNGWKGRLPGPGLVGGDVTNSCLSVMTYTGSGGRGSALGGAGGARYVDGRAGGSGGNRKSSGGSSEEGGGRGHAFVYQFTFVTAG